MVANQGSYETKPGPTSGAAYSGAGERVSDDVAKLKTDISNLADSVRKLASEKVGTTAEDVQVKAQEKLGELESLVHKNPTQSALIAAGVGFVIGLILTR